MYIIGDTHGLMNLYNILSRFFIEHPEINSPTFIHVGDVGIGFYPWERDFTILKNIDNLLREKEATLMCIRGNHDNPIFFGCRETIYDEDKGSLTNIGFIWDNYVGRIEGRKILFIGGAVSIDRRLRTEGRDWWSNEVIYRWPMNTFDIIVDDTDIDTIITHTSPLEAFPLVNNAHDMFGMHLGDDITKERTYLSEVYSRLSERNPIRNWFYGHYHTSQIGYNGVTRFECVNQDSIVEFNFN